MCSNKPSDTCKCRPCTYPNGVFILIVAQILLVAASALAVAAAVDCQFVTVEASLVDPFLTTIFPDESTTVEPNNNDRGLGFFVWEGVDGKCTWEHNYTYTETAWQEYRDFLGSGWDGARAMACFSAFCAWALLIWLLVFSCVAHRKVLRYIFGGVLLVLMTIFQSITFAVMDSDFCNENDCQIGRSARCSAVAVGLYAMTGILLFCSKDYPGARNVDGQSPIAPQDSEKPNEEGTVDHRDEEEPQHDGFADAQEVPPESDLVDVALVDSSAPAGKAMIY
jgi:hypothetical protein